MHTQCWPPLGYGYALWLRLLLDTGYQRERNQATSGAHPKSGLCDTPGFGEAMRLYEAISLFFVRRGERSEAAKPTHTHSPKCLQARAALPSNPVRQQHVGGR
jgi:hypothetical protein